jgi:predicted methyltransferase
MVLSKGNRMKSPSYRHILTTVIAVAVSLSVACAARAQTSPPGGVAETPPVPADKIPKYVSDAVNSPDRPAADRALDAGRQPAQILTFFGIKPGMQVADIFAGGGYTTELLSRVVGPMGKVYSQNFQFPAKFAKVQANYNARLKEPALSNVVPVSKQFNAPDLLPVPPGSLDAVIIQENYHDLVGQNLSPENVNAQVFKALKPGGFYCIVDHSAANGSGARDAATLHRIDEQYEIDQIEKAGFKLAAASSALRHPEDDRTWNVFKKRGETDRFMLKFVKPS